MLFAAATGRQLSLAATLPERLLILDFPSPSDERAQDPDAGLLCAET